MTTAKDDRGQKTRQKEQIKSCKRKREWDEIEKLNQVIKELDVTREKFSKFDQLPLSRYTLQALRDNHYVKLTEIQACAIPHGLMGRDIVGSARTGSGKTLAFIIPVLENLYRKRCVGPDAGLAALIISPTRELSAQIFNVLHKIGSRGHLFAAGLIIGGKSLREEQAAMVRMNVCVGTPGRILQHLSQTPNFTIDNLEILVLDEADRILDMGFQHEVDAIMEYLPRSRQTMLFSATQTKRVSDLVRLNVNNPEYISVHEDHDTSTPVTLKQSYIVTELPKKIDVLWSFIRTIKSKKCLIFLSSGKQVRFIFEAFCKLQPGTPLLHLHGRQKLTRRLDIVEKFSKLKSSCLFATDVASRGLDFPTVDWVVQVDCPEDADTYIHRVGRTARYENNGHAVLFLDPSEQAPMLQRLQQHKVPIENLNVRATKLKSIKPQLQNLCFKYPEIKYLGQKAFTSYVRSIHIQKDKSVFHLEDLDLDAFAAAIGLPGTPKIKFIQGVDVKSIKNAPRASRHLQVESSSSDHDSDSESAHSSTNSEGEKKAQSAKVKENVRTKYDRMFERKNQDILSKHYLGLLDRDQDGEDDTEQPFMTVKRRIVYDEAGKGLGSHATTAGPSGRFKAGAGKIVDGDQTIYIDSKRREKMLKSRKKMLKFKSRGVRILFDDEGNPKPAYDIETEDKFLKELAPKGEGNNMLSELQKSYLTREKESIQIADVQDKQVVREKRAEKREKRKNRWLTRSDDEREGGLHHGGVTLATFSGDEDTNEDEIVERFEDEQSDGSAREVNELENLAVKLLRNDNS